MKRRGFLGLVASVFAAPLAAKLVTNAPPPPVDALHFVGNALPPSPPVPGTVYLDPNSVYGNLAEDYANVEYSSFRGLR